LGTKKDELPDFEKRKRKLEQNPDHPESIKQRKLENEVTHYLYQKALIQTFHTSLLTTK
jgi:hypothetical protein